MQKNSILKNRAHKFAAAIVLAIVCACIVAGIAFAVYNAANASFQAPSLNVTKTAEWTDSDKKNVKINITADAYGKLDYSGESTPNILYVGSLCSSNNHSSDILKASINAVATKGNVDYYLSKYQNDGYDTTSGTVNKGSSISSTTDFSMNTTPYILGGMLDNLYTALSPKSKSYDVVILDFPSTDVAKYYGDSRTSWGKTYKYPISTHENEVAGLLRPYYANDKVVWSTSSWSQDFGGYGYYYPSNSGLSSEQYTALRAMVCPDFYDIAIDVDYKDKALPADRQTSYAYSNKVADNNAVQELPEFMDDMFIEKYSIDFSDKLMDSFNIDTANTYVETSLNGQVWEKLDVAPTISGNQVLVNVDGLRKHKYVRLTINAINNAKGFEGNPNDGEANITMKGERSTDIPKSISIERVLDQSIHIKYRTENESLGTVSVKEEVASKDSDIAGSIAEPKDNHEFVKWTNSKGDVVSTDAHLIPDKSKTGGFNVDDTYTAHFSPISLGVNKKAEWITDDKGQVSIIANAAGKGENYVPNVLFIGTLCDAHTMEQKTVEESLKELSKTSNVDYYLFNKDPYKSFDMAGSFGMGSGGLSAYEKQCLKLHTNNHHALGPFLKSLYNQLNYRGPNYYDFIVLEFDGTRIADMYGEYKKDIGPGIYINPPLPDNIKVGDIAEILEAYYASDPPKVIWVTDDSNSNYKPTDKYNTGSDKQLSNATYNNFIALVRPDLYGMAESGKTYDGLESGRQTNYKNTDKLLDFLSGAIESLKQYRLNFNDTIHVDENLKIDGDPQLFTSEDGIHWDSYVGGEINIDREHGIVSARVEGLTDHRFMKLVVNVVDNGETKFRQVSKDGDPNDGNVQVTVESGGDTYTKDASTEEPLNWGITIKYESEDISKGSVSNDSENLETNTPRENLEGSKAQPNEEWDIDYWEREFDHEKIYDTSETFLPPQNEFGRYKPDTYIVHFKPRLLTVDYDVIGDPDWGKPKYDLPPADQSVQYKKTDYILANDPSTIDQSAYGVPGQWEFSGWYYDEERTEKIPNNILVGPLTDNVRVYGKWIFKPICLDVKYYVEGDASYNIPDDSIKPDDASIYKYSDYDVELICGTQWHASEGKDIGIKGAWTFKGWFDNPQYFGDPITNIKNVENNLNFYGKWTFTPDKFRVDYYITADEKWGRPEDTATPIDASVDYGSSFILTSPITTKCDYAYDAYSQKIDGSWSFTGWCPDQSCEKDPITEFTNISEDKRAYGKWEFIPIQWEVNYVVALDPSWGRPGDDGGDPLKDFVQDKDPYDVDASLSTSWTTHNGEIDGIRGQWEFIGWSENSSTYKPTKERYEHVTENKNLFGKWVFKPIAHNVIYSVESITPKWGIPEGKVAPKPVSVIDGSSYALDASLSTSWTTSDGTEAGIKGEWKFTGWTSDTTLKTPVEEFRDIRDDKYAYGVWQFIPKHWEIKYEVVNDPSWGRPADDGGDKETVFVQDKSPYGVDASLSTHWHSNNGLSDGISGTWTFTGWSENPVTYDPLVTRFDSVTNDHTLYGKWQFAPEYHDVTYHVEADPSWGKIPEGKVAPEPASIIDGSSYTLDASLSTTWTTLDGTKDSASGEWTFTGWCTDQSCEEDPITEFTNIREDKNIYGKWVFTPKYWIVDYTLAPDPSWGVPENKVPPTEDVVMDKDPYTVVDKQTTTWTTSKGDASSEGGTWKFSGWSENGQTYEPTKENYDHVTENKHLFGKWIFEPKYHNVKYIVEGDAKYKIPEDSIIPKDASIYDNKNYTVEKICGTEWKTSDGTEAGIDGAWTFNGWYDNPEYSKPQAKIKTAVHADLTFYGKWTFTPNKVRVDYFVTDDEKWGRPDDTTTPIDVEGIDSGADYKLDEPLATSTSFAKNKNGIEVDGSWTFVGWCPDQSCEEKPIKEFKDIREHKRAYGKWIFTPKIWEVKYTVIEDDIYGRPGDDGGDPSKDNVIDEDPYAVDASLQTSWTTHNGKEDGISGIWIFIGWSENQKTLDPLIGKYDHVSSNKQLFGKWEFKPNYHSITYHVAGDASYKIPDCEIPDSSTVIDGGDFRLDPSLSTTWQTSDGTKDGLLGKWTFTGWCADQSCEQKPITEITNVRQDEDVYGKWTFTPKQWVIDYSVLEDQRYGRPGDDGGNPQTVAVYDKSPYIVDASLSTQWTTHNGKPDGIKGKWTFTGWSDNNKTYSPIVKSFASIISDTTLYGKWVFEPLLHNVVFDLQGHEVPGPEDQSVEHDGYAKRPTEDPVDPGYKFDGWYKDQQCSQEFVFENMPIVEDTIIYAKWTKEDKVPLHYVADIGGSVDPSLELLYPKSISKGSVATANVGYDFVNWTDEVGEVVGTDLKFVPDGPPEGGWKETTFTAHFKLNTKIEKSVNKLEATAGDVLSYTITVSNNTDKQISLATVTDVVPDGLIDIVVDQKGSYDPVKRLVTWENLNIERKSFVKLSFNAKIPIQLHTETNYDNQAKFYFGSGQTIESNVVKTTAYPKKTSILVHKNWTDTDINHDAINVNLYRESMYSDPIESFSLSKDSVVEGVSWSHKSSELNVYDDHGNIIKYIVRELDKDGNPVDEQHVLHVDDKHSYTVSYAYTDAPDGSRISASITNSYIVTNNDLKIAKTTIKDKALPGENIPYDITIENKAIGGIAKDVSIEDVLPEGLIFVNADSGGQYNPQMRLVSWTIKEIPQSKPAILHLVCKVPEDAKTAVYSNTVTICGYDIPKIPDQSAPGEILNPLPKPSIGVNISKTILREDTDYIYTNEEPGNKAILSYYCFKYHVDELYNPVITDILPFGIEPDKDASDYNPEEWSAPDPSSGRYTFTRHLDKSLTDEKTQVLVSVKLFDKFDKDTSLISNALLDTTIDVDPRTQKISAVSNPTEMVIVVPREPIKPDKPAITEVKDIKVTKTWSDTESAHQSDSVEVTLYQDGKPYLSPQVLNAANKWTYTWTKLPVLKDVGGKKVQIVYEVKETKGKDGYIENYDVDDYGNTIISNTKKDVPPSPSPTPSPDQKVSPKVANEAYPLTQTGEIISIIAILVVAFIAILFGRIVFRKFHK